MINEPLKDRLLHYEVPPHPSAWETIADELLQCNDLPGISKKMISYEVPPPIDSWKKIRQSLLADQQMAGSQVFLPKSFPLYKLVAAACVIGLLVTVTFYISNLDNNKLKAGKLPENTENDKNAASSPISSKTGSHLVRQGEGDEVAVTTAENSINSKDGSQQRDMELKTSQVRQSIADYDPEINITTRPIRNLNGEIIQDIDILDNGDQYISITSPSGQQTKISSKFLHMLLFINDDSNIDEMEGYFDKDFLESLAWRSTFQQWRNKIISTSFVPSSTNFMDILELKDLITKDQ